MVADKDLRSIQEVRVLLQRAAEAQAGLARMDQAALDRIVEAMVRAGEEAAGQLARQAVEETGFGVEADKLTKNLVATRELGESIRGMRTTGVLRNLPEKRITEIAAPMGVIAAIIPSTNPTSTAMYKAIISLKAANAVVMSPHPAATRCIQEASRVMARAAESAGAPPGAVSCLSVPTMEGTQELMRHRLTAMILATGGTGLVRAAYSSGKPALGVGPGNVPAFIERTADVPAAVRKILLSKTFDNGTVCASEQSIVADRPVAQRIESELVRQGARFLDPEEARQVAEVLVTPRGGINPRIVGQPAGRIARMAGIQVEPETRVLVARLTEVGPAEPLSMEKLSPILGYFVVDGWREACLLCQKIIDFGGVGHTLAIHSNDQDVILQFALEKQVFRILANTPSTHGAVGATTGLDPALTLGCGTWGGSATSDNVSPLHLIHIKRLAFDLEAPETPGADPDPGAGPAWPGEDRIRSIVRQVVQERRSGRNP